jgi:hypothetical protein
MKKIFSLFIIFAFSQLTNGQSKEETAVANAVEKLRMAMIDGNGPALENMVSEKLSYGHSGGHIDDKKEFVEKLATGKSDFVSMDLTEQTISISGNTAIVRHILTGKTNDAGKLGDINLRVLLIWQKQKGHWILLARQAVKIT